VITFRKKVFDDAYESISIRTEKNGIRRIGRVSGMYVKLIAQRAETDLASDQIAVSFQLSRIEQHLRNVGKAVASKKPTPAKNVSQIFGLGWRLASQHTCMCRRRRRDEPIILTLKEFPKGHESQRPVVESSIDQ